MENMSIVPLNGTNNETTVILPDEPIITVISQSALGIIGIFANLSVIVTLSTRRKLRNKIINMYIINQSIIDLLASFFLLLVGITVRNSYSVELGLLGKLHCLFWKTRWLLWCMYVASTYNIVMMSIERYLELVHSLWHRVYFTKKAVYISISLTWIIGFVIVSTYQLPTSKAIGGICFLYAIWPNLLTSQIVGVYVVIIVVVIPVCILIFIYSRIAWILSRKVNKDVLSENTHPGENSKKSTNIAADMRRKNYELAKRNTIKTLVLVAVCFVICWTGNQVWFLLYNIGYEVKFDSQAYQFFVLMVCVNCTINPFIYLVQYKEYQMALRALICGERKHKSPNESQSISTIDTSEDNMT